LGGAKIWVTNIGGTKILGKYIFRQKILKKFPSILSKISDELFFYKIDTFHSKCTPFSLYFSFFVSVSAFFHVYFLKIQKIKQFSSDYWGSTKEGFCPPILIIGRRVPGLPPESTPMDRVNSAKIVLEK